MARKLLCEQCHTKTKESAQKYGEYFKSTKGTAIRLFYCDSCGIEIKTDDVCFPSCLLNSPNHFNAEAHDPEAWGYQFILEKDANKQ